MQRCLELASLAAGDTAPNPLVGAVLVYEGRIIGEGNHEKFGGPHAEVNCLKNVSPENFPLLKNSTLYVSLEPCAHFGKTPPCADMIIREGIPRVVIGCTDSFKKVNGGGIAKLRAAGIDVVTGVLEKECRKLNKRFFTFHEKQRPYIILKWAQSTDGKMAGVGGQTRKISNHFTDRLVHKWRAEEASIFVGTNTVLQDDPALTVRHWRGKDPVRIIIDNELKTLASAKVFDGSVKTIVINREKEEANDMLIFFRLNDNETFESGFVRCMQTHSLNSVLVEGGTKTLQAFFDVGLWDEARVITNTQLHIGEGVAAPQVINGILVSTESIDSDRIAIYKNPGNEFL